MPIFSTVIEQDAHTQADGSRYTRELHTDHVGKQHRFEYLIRGAMDKDAIAAARAVRLEEEMPEREVDQVLAIDTAPTLNWQTGAQFLARLRERYRDATREDVARIAQWLINRLDAGDVTVTQLRNAFGLTPAQWDTLETKMRNLKSAMGGVDAAKGE